MVIAFWTIERTAAIQDFQELAMKAGLTHLCAALLLMMAPALAAADDAEWLVAP